MGRSFLFRNEMKKRRAFAVVSVLVVLGVASAGTPPVPSPKQRQFPRSFVSEVAYRHARSAFVGRLRAEGENPANWDIPTGPWHAHIEDKFPRFVVSATATKVKGKGAPLTRSWTAVVESKPGRLWRVVSLR
jgi:hypothetical protein